MQSCKTHDLASTYIYIYIHIEKYIYIHIQRHIFIYTYTHLYIYTSVYIFIHIYVNTYMDILENWCIYIILYIFIYISLYIYINIYIYIYMILARVLQSSIIVVASFDCSLFISSVLSSSPLFVLVRWVGFRVPALSRDELDDRYWRA
jgi:hypothetical protein